MWWGWVVPFAETGNGGGRGTSSKQKWVPLWTCLMAIPIRCLTQQLKSPQTWVQIPACPCPGCVILGQLLSELPFVHCKMVIIVISPLKDCELNEKIVSAHSTVYPYAWCIVSTQKVVNHYNQYEFEWNEQLQAFFWFISHVSNLYFSSSAPVGNIDFYSFCLLFLRSEDLPAAQLFDGTLFTKGKFWDGNSVLSPHLTSRWRPSSMHLLVVLILWSQETGSANTKPNP